MSFSQRSSGADHPHLITSESCQPSFTQGSGLKLLDLIYSFPSCLSRAVENFLFCITLLMKRKESWVVVVGWWWWCVSPHHMEGKKKGEEKS